MKARRKVAITVLLLAGLGLVVPSAVASAPSCEEIDPFCYQPAAEKQIDTIRNIKMPSIAVPNWLEGGQ